MPAISKIRFTNVVYEDGLKRYNDEIFKFDGYNGAILLENGGGKTVYIQTALQAILPHTNLADRKIKQTLQLDNYPAHIAIEWVLSENPRRYLVTCVSLFLTKEGLGSYRYVYSYPAGDRHSIEEIPFVRNDSNRPADRGEISDYYQQMTQQHMNAKTFSTIKDFQGYIEDQYHIISKEWDSIVKINSTEGGVEAFFDECKQTNQLFDRLLIPTVENAIAGHDPNTFADTFEKHRSNFKLYKELKEQIEENKAIEEELNRYVETFTGLDEQEQAYKQTKERAKAVMDLIHEQNREFESKSQEVQEKFEQWEMEDKNLRVKQSSLKIQQEQMELDKWTEELSENERKRDEVKGNLTEVENRFNSLKLAELKLEDRIEKDRLEALENQLKTIDQDEEISEVEDQLEENSQELMGYFTDELEKVDKRIRSLQLEKQPLENQILEVKEKVQVELELLNKLNADYNNNKGKLEFQNKEMNRICQHILSNPDQESVQERLHEWEKRSAFLDEEIVKLKGQIKEFNQRIGEWEADKEKVEEAKATKEKAKFKLETEVDQFESAHIKVKEILANLRSQWSTLDSIYLKQESITQQIQDKLLRLNTEREEGLYKERLAHRFIDDYGEQDLFFADPYLEKHINQWKNQFDLLETGVEFIQSLDESVANHIKRYPLWPVTIITTESDKEKVREKLNHTRHQLQLPIEVISINVARSIVKGEKSDFNSIVPEHWSSNQQVDLFHEWKRKVEEQASEATRKRQEIEVSVNKWNNGSEQLESFLKDFPYNAYQERKEHISELKQTIQRFDAEKQDLHRKITELEDKKTTQLDHIDTNEKEHTGLQGRLEKAHLFLQLEKDNHDIRKNQEQLIAQMDEGNNTKKRLELRLERLENDVTRLDEEQRNDYYYRNQLLDDPLYNEVKNFDPKFTNMTRQVLVEKRKELEFSLRKLSSTRNEIQIKLENAKKNLERMIKAMDELRKDHEDLNEDLAFPPNGKEQIDICREQIKELKNLAENADEEFNQWKEKVWGQKEKVRFLINQFETDFPYHELQVFAESLHEVVIKLNAEKVQLGEHRKFLIREQKRVDLELRNINEAFIKLDRFDEAHHFKGPSVVSAVLSEEETQAFTYGRLDFVTDITEQLKKMQSKVANEKDKVDKAKDAFITFCKNKITNVKMREMARQGVEHKRTFKEVTEFQVNMQKRIQNAIKYNEESIMDHDKQLEQFVTHIHSHLRTIAHELELIPKKTKVKVRDKWKEIYKFAIPDWQEEEGKNRIREHIEWILEQLDKKAFVNDEGKEDYGKIRKETETWLQSKQLLRIVMNNEMMKVTCRKVTNDNQVTTRSYSWEQTNVWSGGEKWSKNMTLFLGILNYVAEKQKHIEPNMKRHRAVILDNPFGKASSDHVLNPVFFIAEQLGFQIIALTAHAEGKFLRDYFPVIYSCRLRPAADPTKQIMTKEKHLHHAYFQDHEPQAIERLGEVEQLELF